MGMGCMLGIVNFSHEFRVILAYNNYNFVIRILCEMYPFLQWRDRLL